MKLTKRFFQGSGALGHTIAELWYLLRQSWKPVTLFSLGYSAVFLALVISLRDAFLWGNTRFLDLRYLSPDTLKQMLTAIPTIVTIPLLCLGLLCAMVFQIGALCHAFSVANIGLTPTLRGMLVAAAESCRKYLNPRNWMIIPFLLFLMPITSVMALSNSSLSVVIPGFILDFIAQNDLYSFLLLVVYLILFLVSFAGIFAPLLFLAYDIPFNKAYRKSCRLTRRHYWEIFLSVAMADFLLFVATTAIAAVIARLYSGFSALQADAGSFSSAASVGSRLFLLSDLLAAFVSPIMNNALLTVLFFKYHEQEGSIGELSAQVFRDRRGNTALLAVVGCVALLICGSCVLRYSGTLLHITDPSTRPAVIAHRGSSTRAPENTMPAFQLALQEQPDWIELDVHQTKDGVIVVSHDDDLSLVAQQKIFVHELTYEELITYDVGSWFGPEFSDVRISTLDEVLKLFKDKIPVQIEIKPSGYDVDLEEHILQVVYDNDMQDQVIFTCLKPGPLQRIKELGSDIPTVYSMFFAWGHIEEMEFSDYFTIEERNVTRTLVDSIHLAGKKVFAWTVNSESSVQYLVDCGVDGILTDDPVMLHNALNRANYSGGLSKLIRFFTNLLSEGV